VSADRELEEERRLPVPPAAAGQRLDRFLAAAVPERSRSALARLVREGAVSLGGRPGRPGELLRGGEVLCLRLPAATPLDLVPAPIPLTLLHEDEHLAVVDKPAGLVVHPAPGHAEGTLVHALLYHLTGLAGIGDRLRPGIVHRLDKDTSGLLLVAKTDAAHRRLSAMIAARTVKREYLALVWGRLPAAAGELRGAIGRDPRQRKRMAVLPAGGRPACTRYWRIDTLPGFDYIRLELETGRTHQIRVHLAEFGHPVVGDPLYGGRRGRGDGRSREEQARLRLLKEALARQALHAWRLSFVHPFTGEPQVFTAPLPPDMRAALGLLGCERTTPDEQGVAG
jgi:23S rRNA pseudouridine1911/1915/1917 synthase